MCAYISCNRCEFHPGSVIDKKYAVEAILGEGTFGKVYRVRRLDDDKTFALKLLKLWAVESSEREKLLRRFEQEYETGRIPSEYLVQSHGKGSVEGNPYILMEYCPGGDIIAGVEAGRVDLAKAAAEILTGLKVLHVNGKVHRDLKPENVLIKTDGKMALTDFGIAGDRNKRLTERGFTGVPKEVLGTYAYMPPEQVNPRRGEATVLPTTDIFSFGVMMYQLLTGELPFGSLTDQSELYQYVTKVKGGQWDQGKLRAAKGGEQWSALINGCLNPDFHHRIQTADLALALVPKGKGGAPGADGATPAVPQVKAGIALRVMQGEEFGKVYRLNDLAKANGRRILTLGRNDIEISNVLPIKETQSAYVSRKHCTLEYDPAHEAWLLRDGQWDVGSCAQWRPSTNGTYLGSREVGTNGVRINLGDIISIGDVKLRVEGY